MSGDKLTPRQRQELRELWPELAIVLVCAICFVIILAVLSVR